MVKIKMLFAIIMLLCNACNTVQPTQIAETSPLVSPLHPKPFSSPVNVAPVMTPSATPTLATTPTVPNRVTPNPTFTAQPASTPTPSDSRYGVWMTKPTYEIDSPLFFLAEFETVKWILISDQAQSSIAHQTIAGCQIVPSGGRGLTPADSVSRSYKQLGTLRYELNAVSQQEKLGFINYCTYWSEVATCFGVMLQRVLQEQKTLCIRDAETVLKTARIYDPLATAVP